VPDIEGTDTIDQIAKTEIVPVGSAPNVHSPK
jgi:hypothetical protein